MVPDIILSFQIQPQSNAFNLLPFQVYDELLKMMFAQEGLTLSPTDIEKYSEFIAKEEPKKFESQEKCERVS